MYYWKCKPDGTVEMYLRKSTYSAWQYLEDTLCDKFNYVTMVVIDCEKIFVWHKDMKRISQD